MNQQYKHAKSEDARLQLVLTLDSSGRREMTATVGMTVLNDEEQVQFDAEVEDLFAQLVRQQVRSEISNVQR